MELLVTELVLLAPLFVAGGLAQLLVPHRVHAWQQRLASRFRPARHRPGPASLTPAHASLASGHALRMRIAGGVAAALGLGILALLRPVPFHVGSEAPASDDGALRATVARAMAPLLESGKAVGVAVGVVDSTGTHVFGFGRARLDRREPPDGRTVFEIGSITKVFTTLLLVRMVEQGRLRLDQPVEELLPDSVRVPRFEGQPITLEHLATHRSGLPRIPSNLGIRPSDLVPSLSNPYADYGVDRLYRYLETARLRRAPRAQVSYSNLGGGLLGHALERAAGVDYETLVRREVCEPLGMADTRVELNLELRERLAQGYVVSPLSLVGWKLAFPTRLWDSGSLAGAGCLRSTVDDMLRFLEANLGAVHTPLAAAMDSTHRPRYAEAERLKVGLGWFTRFPKDGREPIVWHNGGTGGYRSFIGFMRERCVGVVVLANTTTDIDVAAVRLLRELR